MQVVLLVATALLALGLVPLLLLASNRYLGSSMFSPIKTPTASATQVGRQGAQRRAALQAGEPRRTALAVAGPPWWQQGAKLRCSAVVLAGYGRRKPPTARQPVARQATSFQPLF